MTGLKTDMADPGLQEDLLGSEMAAEVEAHKQTQQLLQAASLHDLDTLRALLKTVPATVRDPNTGYTGLHSAISSCGNHAKSRILNGESVLPQSEGAQDGNERATESLRLLLQNGAIWNDLDSNNETPGCMAWRIGFKEAYEIMVDAGVRAELLMNRLDDFEILSDASDDAETDEDLGQNAEEASRLADAANALDEDLQQDAATVNLGAPQVSELATEPIAAPDDDSSTRNPQYLSSSLSFTSDRILDAAANGVMMSWESSLMERTAAAILPTKGLKVLNIGFGMGIFDTFVQNNHEPPQHHIVEAHPDVLNQMKETGWDSSAPSYNKQNVTIHPGTWQEVLPQLIKQNLTFDAIFFDTFAEDYKAFREFFSEYVIGLLEQEGRWSFFHGLCADRQVCYDVYTKVVEMDLFEAGFEVEWQDVELPELKRGTKEGDTWEGVKRSYFSVEKYRLPVCKFVG